MLQVCCSPGPLHSPSVTYVRKGCPPCFACRCVLFQNPRSRAYYGDLVLLNQELVLPSTTSQPAHSGRPGTSLPAAPHSHLHQDQPQPEGHVDGGTLLRLLLQGCVADQGAGQGALEDMLQALARGQVRPAAFRLACRTVLHCTATGNMTALMHQGGLPGGGTVAVSSLHHDATAWHSRAKATS